MIKDLKNSIYIYLNFSYGLKDLILFSKSGKYLKSKVNGNLSVEEAIIKSNNKAKTERLDSLEKQLEVLSLTPLNPKRGDYGGLLNDIQTQIMKNNLCDYADFILFGSMASEDYVKEFSDTDIIMFLKEEVFSSEKRLKWFKMKIHELNGLLLRVDPLQDHGIFTVLPHEKEAYNQAVNIPIDVLNKGCSLGKEVKLSLGVIETSPSTLKKILDNYIDLSLRETQHITNSVRFNRNFLHRVFLLPAFYLQANGTHCYKRDSFKLIKSDKRFSVVNKLCEYYNESYNQKRNYRWIPKFFFLKCPLLMRLMLEKIFGQKNQSYYSERGLIENVEKFRTLLNSIKVNG